MKVRIATSTAVAILALAGCVSALKSQDPAVRKQAMEQITDQKELFFIAMNIGVGIKDKWPELYSETHLRQGEYPEDVRVMAVDKLTDTDYLLRCAAWRDGDLYADKASEDGRFTYRGETYCLYGDYEFDMMESVSPGDAVRDAAKKRLKIRAVGESFAGDVKSTLLPSAGSRYGDGKETTFRTCYGDIKSDNPYDLILCDLVDAEDSTAEIVSFLMQASVGGPYLAPKAYGKALRKINCIDSATAKRLFRKLFFGIDDAESDGSSRGGKSKAIENPPKDWAWLVYRHIDDPGLDIVEAALERSDETETGNILGRVKNPNVLVSIFCGEEIAKRMPKCKTETLYDAYGSKRVDLSGDVAAEMLKRVSSQDSLEVLARGARLFSIRAAAIARVENQDELAKIARGDIWNCPYDASLDNYSPISDGFAWNSNAKKASELKLQKLAIAQLKDAELLRDVRKECGSDIVKKAVTDRLYEIGQSDVDEICAYEKYDPDLFSMIEWLKDKADIQKVAQSARLKGVRLLAGSRLDADVFASLSQKEAEGVSCKPGDGRLSVAGYCLGMNIEDAFAKLTAEHPDIKPTMYLDDGVLCVSGSDGRDIARANAESLDIHWLTLPLSIVKRMAGFKEGSIDDLERAVEGELGISFGYDVLVSGSARQRIGNFENVEGETLRYFADENRADAKSSMFQPQGSLQLLLTKNAAKGSHGAKGSMRRRTKK